jgi:hypothetical protein
VQRHDFDIASFVMGVALLLVAVGAVVADVENSTVNLRWVLPVVLLGLGGAGFAGTLIGRKDADADPVPNAERH